MDTLPVAADAALLIRAGAATLLIAHIAGGTTAILSAEVAAFVYVSLLVAAAVLLGARAGGNAGGRGTPVPLVS